MSEHIIFAWTERTPPEGYPAYVSINRDQQGRHTITVRSRGGDGHNVVTVEIPVEQLEALLCALAADLYRDENSDAITKVEGRS